MQVNNSQPSFGMAVNYPKFPKGSFEDNAINLARPILDAMGETRDIKVRIKHRRSDNLVGWNHDVICRTTVSAPNKTPLGEVKNFFGLMPQVKHKSTFDVSLFPLSESSLANYIIRDAQNAAGKFDRIHNSTRKKRSQRIYNSTTSFGNFSKVKKAAIKEANSELDDLAQMHKLKFRVREENDRVLLTAIVSDKPQGLMERIQSLRGKLPNVQLGGSVSSADLELYPEKLTQALVAKTKEAAIIFSGKRVDINPSLSTQA